MIRFQNALPVAAAASLGAPGALEAGADGPAGAVVTTGDRRGVLPLHDRGRVDHHVADEIGVEINLAAFFLCDGSDQLGPIGKLERHGPEDRSGREQPEEQANRKQG